MLRRLILPHVCATSSGRQNVCVTLVGAMLSTTALLLGRVCIVRIVVTGLLGQYAFGGVTWDYIQYLLGFRALGHDVWYLEDSGAWPYDPVGKTVSADCTYNVNYLAGMMAEFGFGDRWIYRNGADGKFHGAG